ncbi:MAG: DNA polymerase III subunit alpha [Phycisphaeraceae bacterium]|nr:DNA polymerase III subunit alpha [Phycisphaeraceae bacterium]
MDGTKNGKGTAPARFVHLHLHSEYSLLDGGNRFKPLVERVKELGMDAVAVTDHGNLHGAWEFHEVARAAGVKPILGIEAYVALGDRRDRTHTGSVDGGFHLVLLAETMEGWRNLLKLSSDAFLNGFYYKPRMDKSTLAERSAGLIAINGHLGSSIAHHLLAFVQGGDQRHWESALEEARWHAKTFAPNERGEPCFFVELQRHIEEQESINPLLIKLARELDLPLVCDNDAHFLRREDHDTHDTLFCISLQKQKDQVDRIRYSPELYVKSPEEMVALFPEVPEAVANTVAIAERCNVELPSKANHAPVVRVVRPKRLDPYDGGDLTAWFKRVCRTVELHPFDATRDSESPEELRRGCDEALRLLCEAGLIWRYGVDGVSEAIRARAERELAVLSGKGISAYFLIVWDFVNWARQHGIPATARGSGVGTMVGFVLGLSNACPERFGLLFERFTDPDRAEYPDIDIDLCQDGRARVLDYVRQKYGHVAQIGTFGRLKARAAIKDVARVMGLSPSEGQRLSNLVPAELKITIEQALSKEPELASLYKSDERIRRVIDSARALEDHVRSSSTHAAGVVIATRPLDDIVPLGRPPGGGDEVVTQWDGPTCEAAGLLKMDFLGLRTLSTIERAKALVVEALDEAAIWRAVGRDLKAERTSEAEEAGPGLELAVTEGRELTKRPHPLDLDRLTCDDQRVLALFRRGETQGIFQFESGGMRKLLVDMQPDRLEDLIAANALFRPGPMELIPQYNARKHGREPVPSIHPVVDEITRETYGIMVYQEQVMQVLHQLGGIPLRAAYTIIKAISKKKKEAIEKARSEFVDGAGTRGVAVSMARDLFDLILKFAEYGFNKSHSTGYAIIAYQTAYLKTYFPAQYMAAVLSFESQARKVEEWAVYLEECRRVPFADHAPDRPHIGVDVKPPDVNLSKADFAVVFTPGEARDALHGHIRFGLQAIKGAGEGAIRAIIAERDARGPFKDIFDFCGRVDLRSVNRATVERLVAAGAFDGLHGVEARASLVATIPDAMAAGQALAKDRRSGQMSLLGDFELSAPETASSFVGTLRRVEPWDRITALQKERDSLGFHVSGHPLDEHRRLMEVFCNADTALIQDRPEDAPVVMAAVVTSVRPIFSKGGRDSGSGEQGKKMAMITLADRAGVIDGVCFSEVFAKHGSLLVNDKLVVVAGFVDRRRAEPAIRVERILAIEDTAAHCSTGLDIVLSLPASDADEPIEPVLEMIAGHLRMAAGSFAATRGRPVEVLIQLVLGDRVAVLSSPSLRVVPEAALIRRLREAVGKRGSVRVRGGWVPARPEPPWKKNRVAAMAGAVE